LSSAADPRARQSLRCYRSAATASCWSRKKGTRVFHIGESLLPLNVPLFDRLGVRDEIERIGMRKHGAEFVSPYHGKT